MSVSHSIGPQLSDVDLELLELVCRLRVVTQKQLERLRPDVPDRTLRYRTRRLQRLGLIGRTRPYRDRGSAPHHLWPMNKADALVRGDPPARRGERQAPSPLFLAHAAAVSELYVVLRTRATAARFTVAEFRRESEARESFSDRAGRQRVIVPDARIALCDEHGRLLIGNVELDLGTMTHARLRAKLDGYLAHAEQEAEAVGASSVPTLLFITVGAARAESFLRAAGKLRRQRRWHRAHALNVATCARARHLGGVLSDRCWQQAEGDGLVTLGECARTASAAMPGA